jgi:hypothetical protein
LALTSTRRVSAVVVALCLALALGSGGFVALTRAQGSQVDLNASESVRQAIEQNTGKRVKLKLVSGQDIDGQVAKVGAHAVLLTELTGMEFFEATVRLDQVAAVIVRRAGK